MKQKILSNERPGSAIAKAFMILEMIVDAERPVALNTISENVNLPKPSAYRMLLQLEQNGLVKRDLTGKRFSIGDQFYSICLRAFRTVVHTSAVKDVITTLVTIVGETCNLGVLDGQDILYLERVECDQPLRIHLQAGSRVPVHATAVGKLTLSYISADKRRTLLERPLPKLTRNTFSKEELLSSIPTIRKQKFSTSREESMLGLAGIAVPIFNRNNQFLAGLAIHAPVSRFDKVTMEKALPYLRDAADKIAMTLE